MLNSNDQRARPGEPPRSVGLQFLTTHYIDEAENVDDGKIRCIWTTLSTCCCDACSWGKKYSERSVKFYI